MAETAAQRFARDIAAQDNGGATPDRKNRGWDAKPNERRRREFVNPNGTAQD
jgi:hypothetical protein